MLGNGVWTNRPHARLELKFLPAPQHFGDADVGAEAVAYLLGVGADAMEPQ